MCNYPDCKVYPKYNIKNEKIALFCNTHKTKKDNMINVKDKTCLQEECKKLPLYNIDGEKALYCSIHKKENMIFITSNICKYDGCKKIPCYNIYGKKKGLFCLTHKANNMIDVVHKRCKSSWCQTINTYNHNEGYCLPCFVNNPINKDKPVARNYKTKENETVTRIQESFPEFTWKHDKKVENGFSKRRPDLLLDMGSHIIIIEIDENKHNDYECSCENKRLMEISQDLGHRSIVFIRFNPDSYTNEKGILVKSCWKLNKLGVMTISKKEEWNNRIKVLKEQIQYWIDNPTEKTVEIIQLFY